jgi:hypothetical protein
MAPRQETALMEDYCGYFIDGDARMVHPFDPSWYPNAIVLKSGRRGSIVEVTRFEVPSFKLEDKVVAEWFGREIAKILVDECLSPA